MTEKTIYLPFDPQTSHPLSRTLRLAVWPLSGVAYKQQAFQMKCAKSCSPHGDRQHRNVMKDHGSSGDSKAADVFSLFSAKTTEIVPSRDDKARR